VDPILVVDHKVMQNPSRYSNDRFLSSFENRIGRSSQSSLSKNPSMKNSVRVRPVLSTHHPSPTQNGYVPASSSTAVPTQRSSPQSHASIDEMNGSRQSRSRGLRVRHSTEQIPIGSLKNAAAGLKSIPVDLVPDDGKRIPNDAPRRGQKSRKTETTYPNSDRVTYTQASRDPSSRDSMNSTNYLQGYQQNNQNNGPQEEIRLDSLSVSSRNRMNIHTDELISENLTQEDIDEYHLLFDQRQPSEIAEEIAQMNAEIAKLQNDNTDLHRQKKLMETELENTRSREVDDAQELNRAVEDERRVHANEIAVMRQHLDNTETRIADLEAERDQVQREFMEKIAKVREVQDLTEKNEDDARQYRGQILQLQDELRLNKNSFQVLEEENHDMSYEVDKFREVMSTGRIKIVEARERLVRQRLLTSSIHAWYIFVGQRIIKGNSTAVAESILKRVAEMKKNLELKSTLLDWKGHTKEAILEEEIIRSREESTHNVKELDQMESKLEDLAKEKDQLEEALKEKNQIITNLQGNFEETTLARAREHEMEKKLVSDFVNTIKELEGENEAQDDRVEAQQEIIKQLELLGQCNKVTITKLTEELDTAQKQQEVQETAGERIKELEALCQILQEKQIQKEESKQEEEAVKALEASALYEAHVRIHELEHMLRLAEEYKKSDMKILDRSVTTIRSAGSDKQTDILKNMISPESKASSRQSERTDKRPKSRSSKESSRQRKESYQHHVHIQDDAFDRERDSAIYIQQSIKEEIEDSAEREERESIKQQLQEAIEDSSEKEKRESMRQTVKEETDGIIRKSQYSSLSESLHQPTLCSPVQRPIRAAGICPSLPAPASSITGASPSVHYPGRLISPERGGGPAGSPQINRHRTTTGPLDHCRSTSSIHGSPVRIIHSPKGNYLSTVPNSLQDPLGVLSPDQKLRRSISPPRQRVPDVIKGSPRNVRRSLSGSRSPLGYRSQYHERSADPLGSSSPPPPKRRSSSQSPSDKRQSSLREDKLYQTDPTGRRQLQKRPEHNSSPRNARPIEMNSGSRSNSHRDYKKRLKSPNHQYSRGSSPSREALSALASPSQRLLQLRHAIGHEELIKRQNQVEEIRRLESVLKGLRQKTNGLEAERAHRKRSPEIRTTLSTGAAHSDGRVFYDPPRGTLSSGGLSGQRSPPVTLSPSRSTDHIPQRRDVNKRRDGQEYEPSPGVPSVTGRRTVKKTGKTKNPEPRPDSRYSRQEELRPRPLHLEGGTNADPIQHQAIVVQGHPVPEPLVNGTPSPLSGATFETRILHTCVPIQQQPIIITNEVDAYGNPPSLPPGPGGADPSLGMAKTRLDVSLHQQPRVSSPPPRTAIPDSGFGFEWEAESKPFSDDGYRISGTRTSTMHSTIIPATASASSTYNSLVTQQPLTTSQQVLSPGTLYDGRELRRISDHRTIPLARPLPQSVIGSPFGLQVSHAGLTFG